MDYQDNENEVDIECKEEFTKEDNEHEDTNDISNLNNDNANGQNNSDLHDIYIDSSSDPSIGMPMIYTMF